MQEGDSSSKDSSEAERIVRSMLERDAIYANPEWIELLMGLPMGWTDLEDFQPDRSSSSMNTNRPARYRVVNHTTLKGLRLSAMRWSGKPYTPSP